MEPSSTSIVLVNHDFKALTQRFLVRTTPNDLIVHLKAKVKECFRGSDDIPELNSTSLAMLVVWKTMGTKIINLFSEECLPEILSTIDVNDKNTVQKLSEEVKLVDLGLSNFQSLLVQLPAGVEHNSMVGDPIMKYVDPEYIDCYLQAYEEGSFTGSDIGLNKISENDSVRASEFVTEYERILSQKRMLPPEMDVSPEGMINAGIFAEYFCSMGESSESTPIVSQLELQHLIQLSFVTARSWRALDAEKGIFKEHDACWLLFSAVTDYYETTTSTDDDDGEPIITVKQSLESWPFHLLIKVAGKFHTYEPKSNFLLLRYGLPQLSVEVNSRGLNEPSVNFIRLMLQGASIVRFANTKLDAYKEQKNFVFIAIYIDNSGKVDRYLLYQDEKIDPDNPEYVHRKLRTFYLQNANERARFALELYNLSSTWRDDKHTKEEVEKLKTSVENVVAKLSPFIIWSECSPTDTEGDPPRTQSHWTGDAAGGATGQLEDIGYEVVFEPERDGGTWELIDKPPPHVRIVDQRSDPNKTKYIAKHVREGSNELAIHEYLQSRQSQSPYVISLIEAVPLTTREWLILPKLYSIRSQWPLAKRGIAGRVQLGWGLIKGLAYLHEHKIAHRDIKPGNLVRDRDFNLKIIDFDIAIKVEDENTEINGYWGTEGWTAPEIGREDGQTVTMYSPIKADRWSCGRVILHHILAGFEKGDHRLLSLLDFANQLMANDPQQRPSWLAWQAFLAPPLTVMHDREDMKPPDAKKRRIESELVQS